MSEQTQLAVVPKASDALALFLGMEKGIMIDTLKVQCFRGCRADQVSEAQLAAFVSTANVLQVNPLVPGMLYAYPTQDGGITPILGPDGVFKKLDEAIMNGKILSYQCDVFPETGKPTHAVAVITRNEHSVARYVAHFDEWYVDKNPNWKWKPRHMLWLRGIKQAARQVIHGLPEDNDEYSLRTMIDVTPAGEEPPAGEGTPKTERKAAPAKTPKGAQTVTAEPKNVTPAATTSPATTPTKPATQEAQIVEETPKAPAATTRPAATPPATAAKPAPAAVPAAAQTEERAFLKENESVTLVVQVVSVATLLANVKKEDGSVAPNVPSVQVETKGGFRGSIFHFGGAKAEAGGLVPLDVWTAGNMLKVTLFGRMARNNKVIPEVKAVGLNSVADKTAAAAAETPEF